MSHELRTPLNLCLAGNNATGDAHRWAARYKEYLGNIHNSEAISSLINDI
jgi:signal transduction histidine kinase